MEYSDDDFELISLISEGSYGKVYLGLEKGGRKLTVKIPKKKCWDLKILKEIPLSKYLVEYLGYTKDGWIITRYEEGKDLFDIYESGSLKKWPIEKILDIMLKISLGLRDLHLNNIYHLDIKPENILISPDEKNIVLIDYGFSHLAEEPFEKFRMTPSYGSPEMLALFNFPFQKYPITAKTDVYSLGAVFYFMLKFTLPNYASDIYEYAKNLKNLEKIKGAKLFNMIVKMMRISPNQRLSLDQVIEKIEFFINSLN